MFNVCIIILSVYTEKLIYVFVQTKLQREMDSSRRLSITHAVNTFNTKATLIGNLLNRQLSDVSRKKDAINIFFTMADCDLSYPLFGSYQLCKFYWGDIICAPLGLGDYETSTYIEQQTPKLFH